MEFKYSTSILTSKFSLIFKILVYVFCAILLTSVIAACVLIPAERNFSLRSDVKEETKALKDSWDEFTEGESGVKSFVDTAAGFIKKIWNIIKLDRVFLAKALATIIIFYFVTKFLLTLASMPLSFMIDQFMSSGLEYGFMSAFFKNIRHSALYSLIYTAIMVPTNLLIYTLITVIIIELTPALNMFALTLALLLAITLFSLRSTLFCGWLPYFLHSEDKKLFKALRASFKMVKERFNRILMTMFVVFFLMYILIVVLGVVTFGLAFIAGMALLYLILRILELTFYYIYNRKNYYIDRNTIVDSRAIEDRTELQS
ncbi:MAG TPA: hypothetical protein P5161_06585 [Eubacteriales bacterium]|jgi:hypothetical protein|nr:hypothetical protein [Clostridia bacterium]HRR90425.1 hypothetical protein [Eubacteriales bacterium]HRU83963.1 hypothetical protein [Eubacteriales bacterium]